jgi:hypothetical protein
MTDRRFALENDMAGRHWLQSLSEFEIEDAFVRRVECPGLAVVPGQTISFVGVFSFMMGRLRFVYSFSPANRAEADLEFGLVPVQLLHVLTKARCHAQDSPVFKPTIRSRSSVLLMQDTNYFESGHQCANVLLNKRLVKPFPLRF